MVSKIGVISGAVIADDDKRADFCLSIDPAHFPDDLSQLHPIVDALRAFLSGKGLSPYGFSVDRDAKTVSVSARLARAASFTDILGLTDQSGANALSLILDNQKEG